MTEGANAPLYEGRQLVGNRALDESLGVQPPDFAQIGQIIRDAYIEETGDINAEARAIANWLRRANRENPAFHGLSIENTLPRFIMFPELAEKLRYLSRRPCQFCMPFQTVDVICFILKTAPVSRQVGTHKAFKQAVQDYLTRVAHDFSEFYDARLCVAVTFVIGRGRRIADSDNLAKTLLDALQGFAYRNDTQVEHLDLMRLGSLGVDSFIGIRIAKTEIASHVDVVNPEFDVRWVPTEGVGPIDLMPYLADAHTSGD